MRRHLWDAHLDHACDAKVSRFTIWVLLVHCHGREIAQEFGLLLGNDVVDPLEERLLDGHFGGSVLDLLPHLLSH